MNYLQVRELETYINGQIIYKFRKAIRDGVAPDAKGLFEKDIKWKSLWALFLQNGGTKAQFNTLVH